MAPGTGWWWAAAAGCGSGLACLRAGNPSQAAAHLQQALTIYQRIGAPGAQRVQETLRDLSLPGSTE